MSAAKVNKKEERKKICQKKRILNMKAGERSRSMLAVANVSEFIRQSHMRTSKNIKMIQKKTIKKLRGL
jgi:hypothetical protein